MLTLVEPTNMTSMSDHPNLGCGMLIAACRREGIDVKLIKAQTRYIRNMFVEDSDELWELLGNLDTRHAPKRLLKYKNYFRSWPLELFQQELNRLYHEVILNKTAGSFVNPNKINRFITLYNIFSQLYIYYILEHRHLGLQLINRYVREIVSSSPRYLGYSVCGAFSPVSREIIRQVKEKTGIPVIVGGAYAPFVDLEHLDTVMREEGFDYLVVGAAEKALPALLETLEHKKQPEGIPNVFYRENGRVKTNKLEVIDNLDALPFPDFSQFDLDLYPTPVRLLSLQTARGCYWRKCAFCSHHRSDLNKYKTWSVDRVIETLEHLQTTYNCSHFFINDEAIAPVRARKISEAIIDGGLEVHFEVRARFDKPFNDDNLLKTIQTAGFGAIAWGMESACQRVLDLMNKGTKKGTISSILKKAHKNKISNMCFVFCGFPGETKEEWRETVDFLKEHNEFIAGITDGTFVLLKYSPIGRNPDKWGVTATNDGYTVTTGMSMEETEYYYKRYMDDYRAWRRKQNNAFEYLKSAYKGHYVANTFMARMLFFFLSSRGLNGREIRSRLHDNDHDALYPLIPGRMMKGENMVTFFPVNVEKSIFDNFMEPVNEKIFSTLDHVLVGLADGSRHMGDIIDQAALQLNLPTHEIKEKSLGFFKQAFEDKWADFFKSPAADRYRYGRQFTKPVAGHGTRRKEYE
jgi:radical SAM superfamily enzyme YgiQ (UPF0313 family)